MRPARRRAAALPVAALVGALLAAAAPASAQDAADADLASRDANIRIAGQEAADEAAQIAGVGDMNGDDIPDVIVGAAGADNNAGDGRFDSGSAYVVFGQAEPTTVDLDDLGDGGFRIDGAAASDRTGASVAGAGDVDADGTPDVIVGAPDADAPGRTEAGVAYVVLGKSTPGTVDLASGPSAQFFAINGEQADDSLGSSVDGAGDVNGDGTPDLVVGAPNAEPEESGSAYVVFGSPASPPAPVDLAALLPAQGFQIQGADADDGAGSSVGGAGDFNDDGMADVIVGAPQAGPGTASQEGAAYVVFGQSSVAAPVDLGSLGGGGVTIEGAGPGALTGSAVAGAGNVNGDARPDVVVGAPGSAFDDPGSAHVVFGGTGARSVDLSDLGSGGFTIDGAGAGDLAGSAVAGAGDANGDGREDVIVGAPEAPVGDRLDAGSAYVVYGRGGSGTVDAGALGTSGFLVAGEKQSDQAGTSVGGAGDVNGDGLDDVLVGALLAVDTQGAGYVVFTTGVDDGDGDPPGDGGDPPGDGGDPPGDGDGDGDGPGPGDGDEDVDGSPPTEGPAPTDDAAPSPEDAADERVTTDDAGGGGELPFTGLALAALVALGAALLTLGRALRRRSAVDDRGS